MSVTQQVKNLWKSIIVIITPILLLPLVICFPGDASRCGYVILILVIYWVTEAIPMPITSLLPLVLFPLFGVLKATEVAPNYFRDMITLFFGGVTLGYAIQRVNLDRRIALLVLNLARSSIKWIMAGLMVTTWLLSMWTSNVVCASIMVPVALTIADECIKSSYTSIEEQENDISKKKADNLKKGFILCVLYSTFYGGLSTIVGTSVAVFLKGYVDEEYEDTKFRLTFFNYFLVALPASVLMLTFCWIWLQIRFRLFHWSKMNNQSSNQDLRQRLGQQYSEIGYLRWNELIVIGLFLITVTLWITRDLDNGQGGWSVLFRSDYITNGTVVLLISILTMIIPNDNPFTENWTYKPIIEWADHSKKFPWGTLLLLGACLSIANAAKVSKLMDFLESAFEFFQNSSPVVILIVILIITQLLAQFISGVSIASILFPICSSMSHITGVHPAYFLIPCRLAISQAYLLPMASPSTALVFATGLLHPRDLISTGIVLIIANSFIILLAASTWMVPIFDINQPFYTNTTFSNST